MATPSEISSQRLRTALDLIEAGCEMKRMALRRQHQDLGAEEIERPLGAWLRDKPIPLAEVPGFRLRKEPS
jgi:hypothetical protein